MTIVMVNVGLDYHEDSIRVCVVDEQGEVLVNRDVENHPAAVQDLILQWGHPAGIAIEACCGAASFAHEFEKLFEWKIQMAHPGYVKQLKQGPDKTDYGDAHLLADLVRVNYLPEVWIADQFTRQLRRLVRYREGLASQRRDTKLRIRALLREERIRSPQARPWTKAWLAWLDEASLGEHSRWVMSELQQQLQRLEEDLKRVEQHMEAAIADDAVSQKLLEQPGIGLVTAITLRAEVGRFDRFRSGKQLSRYCGVTPRNASSGKRQADAGLVGRSNRNLRAVVIQAAQRLPRHEDRWRELKNRLRKTKPASVATAAIANRWLRWLYHQMLESYEQAA